MPVSTPTAMRIPTRTETALRRLRAGTLAVALLALGAGCASYQERTASAFGDFRGGHFERAAASYSKWKTTRSEFLAGVEAGSAALAGGRWQAALEHFGRAAEQTKAVERTALLSPGKLGEELVSFTISEQAKSYVGEGYERVMLHASAAMAYLALGELEDARVEVRLANSLLESEEKLYEKEYRAGGLGHLISAVSYELEGELDDAYIDYRRMVDKGVGEALAGRALVRLAHRLRFDEDVPEWEKRFGPADEDVSGQASVVVVGAVGLGPYKEEITLPIPTQDGLLQWSVPQYEDRPQSVSALELVVEAASAPVRTVVVEDVGRVARENLEDRIGWLAARSAVRAVLKRELTKHLEDQWDFLGRIVGDVFTFVTERADLRCWQTLPDSWQAARAFLPPGEHGLSLRAVGGDTVELGRYRLEPGETVLVYARTIDTRLYAHVIGGERVVPTPPEPHTLDAP